MGVVAWFLPLACPGCGAAQDGICARCASALPPAPRLGVPAGLDGLVVPFSYEGVVRELVTRVKFRGAHGATGWLAGNIARGLGSRPVDAVTWAPTTASRRRHRGYDQAQLLARALASEIGAPCRGFLRRVSRDAQTGRSAPARRHVAFVTLRPTVRRVLLVDDIVTTGATLTAAAAALRADGALEVVGAAAARTP